MDNNSVIVGSTLIDYEELLSQKPPQVKKKRGTSGLMNLQIARKKKLLRRERMQKLAEKRRIAKLLNTGNSKIQKKKSESVLSCETGDFFLGDRSLSEVEKLIIPLRLTMLMHRDDKINNLCKHPSSIRDSKVYPMFNKIKNVQELLDNPINWTKEQVLIFVGHVTSQKTAAKKLESEDIDGEAILNLTKKDLINFFNLDDSTSEILSTAFEQLRKETIMRYVNT